MKSIAEIALSLIMLLALYWLPGAAFASLLEWRGLGRVAKGLLPLAISLIVAPALLGVMGLFRLPLPPVVLLAIASALSFASGYWLRRKGKRAILEFRIRSAAVPGKKEELAAALFLVFVAAVAFLPRLDLLINGSQIGSAGISDIYWHLSELTSLVRSGLPPQHFLFPDIPLDYYYWSWLLPAAAAGLPFLGNSLMRLMNAHVLAGLLIFLFLLYGFLRANIGSWKARWIALGFLTLAGGYDFFTSPSMYSHEWWQASAAWLVSQNQIPSFLVTYMWVPQHVAGATAFLMALFLWRNVRGGLLARGLLAAVCAAFMFGASAFVFFAFALAAAVWAVLYRRVWMNRRALWRVALVAFVFLAIAGPQILLAAGQGGIVYWGGFRLNLLEALGTSSRYIAPLVDQAITLLAFPLVASAVMCIEVGLPFVLYLGFAFRNVGGNRSAWRRFVAIFPALYLPFALLLVPPNFGMRGILPALIVINLAAALWLEEAGKAPWTKWRKAAVGYGLTMVMLAQTVSPLVEWLPLARRSLADVIRPENSLITLPITFPDGDNTLIPAFTGLPDQLAYIRWANAHLPADALVVEEGPLPDDNRLHLLERMRLADPASVRGQSNGQRDFTLAGSADVAGWWKSLPGKTAVEKALASQYVSERHIPVYVVIRSGSADKNWTLAYKDAFVKIYEIPAGM